MLMDSVIYCNANKFHIVGLGPESFAVIENILSVRLDPVHKRVFKYGLGLKLL